MGSFEVICGLLVLIGLFTRISVIPLITIMLVAIVSTKLPILIDSGFFFMANVSRTDFSMLLGSLFLLINGSGPMSFDWRLANMKGAYDGSK